MGPEKTTQAPLASQVFTVSALLAQTFWGQLAVQQCPRHCTEHSAAPLQTEPAGRFATQAPRLQYGLPAFEQSLSIVQLAKQAVLVPLHLKSPQVVVTPAQAVPVQVVTVCWKPSAPPAPQVGPAQFVVVCAAQSPLLLQVVTALRCTLVLWQLAAGQRFVPCGVAK